MGNKKYNYGKSIISTILKYSFGRKMDKIISGKFKVELIVYCGRKRMYYIDKNFSNISINSAIRNTFQTKVEKRVTFHPNHKYHIDFKVFKERKTRKAVYIKTNDYVETINRDYLLKETINVWI